MALLAPPPVQQPAKGWEIGDYREKYPSPSNSKISAMSYQYPAPPSSGHDMEMSQAEYHQNFGTQPPPLAGIGHHQGSIMSMKNHNDPDSTLRRSFSMPSAQHIESEQAQLAAQGEKKRNKLGYHRTSIACSHCRRRKIRCIPSSENQSTCQNCIRLKKQCSFHPVDQPPADTRSKGSSRTSNSVKSSSPSVSSGNAADLPSQQSFPPVPMSSTPGVVPSNVHQATSEGFSDTKAPWAAHSSNRAFEQGGQPIANWVQSDGGHSEISRPEDLTATWRTYPAESPMSTQFSPYSHAPPPSATWTTGSSDLGSRDDGSWSNFTPPVRSMSYSGEGLGSQQQDPYLAIPQGRQFDRRSSNFSDLYPPSHGLPPPLPMSTIGIGGPGTMDPSGPLPAGPLPSQNQRPWPTQPQLQRHASYSRLGEGFAPPGFGQSGGGQNMQ